MSSDPDAAARRDDPPRANRLLTVSDGVIAIALTLLVLQLRVPTLDQVRDPDSAAALTGLMRYQNSAWIRGTTASLFPGAEAGPHRNDAGVSGPNGAG